MNPVLLTYVTSLALHLIDLFKHRNDVVSEAEIQAAAQDHYKRFLAANDQLTKDAMQRASLEKL